MAEHYGSELLTNESEGNKRRAINPTGNDRIFNIILYASFIILAFLFLYPFIYLIALSFNEGIDAFKGGIYFFPRKFTMENYTAIFRNSKVLNGFNMSVLRTVIGTLATLITTSLVAYGFTKRDLAGYKFYMLSMLIPMYVTAGIIPTFLTYKSYGLINNFLVYLLPNLGWGTTIIIVRAFFDSIPSVLEESAKMDGAGVYTVFFRIYLPLSTPILATISIYNAVWHWNSWFDVVLYTRSGTLDTLMSILARMLMEQQTADIGTLKANDAATQLTAETFRAAMTIVTVIPIVLVYPFLQRYFVKGMMLGAVKG